MIKEIIVLDIPIAYPPKTRILEGQNNITIHK